MFRRTTRWAGAGDAARPDTLFEPLEPRVLLSVDDHADMGDFDNATTLYFNYEDADIFNTIATYTAVKNYIETPDDTDLFRFISPVTTGNTLSLVISGTNKDRLAVGYSIFENHPDDGILLRLGAEHYDPDLGPTVITLWGLDYPLFEEGKEYFLKVHASTAGVNATEMTGWYVPFLFLWFDPDVYQFDPNGHVDPGDPPIDYNDDHPNQQSVFSDPTPIHLTTDDGVGYATGGVDTDIDTDVFSFRATHTGSVTVTVDPEHLQLDPFIKIHDREERTVRAGASATPTEIVEFTFDVVAGRDYDIILGSNTDRTGAYTVRVEHNPIAYKLFYPEGYSSTTIEEFIPMVNPNDFDVSYTVIARYEWGGRDQIISRGTLAPNSRGGITVNVRDDDSRSLTRTGVPYTLEIQTDAPIGATLSHYDFGVTTGESFTNDTSLVWTFAEAHRLDEFRDYLVLHNPHNRAVDVTISLLYPDGQVIELNRSLGPHRRGGVSLYDDPGIDRTGVFGILVESSDPIIAALSSYNIVEQSGFGLLGLNDIGTTIGVIPNVSIGTTELAVLNAGRIDARVNLDFIYQGAFAAQRRTVVIPARTTKRIVLADLNIPDGNGASIRFDSAVAVTMTAIRVGSGDADALTASAFAANAYLFGDAFLNTDLAGTSYFETLSIFNAGDANADVTIEFLFTDGPSFELEFDVQAGDPLLIDLHGLRQLTDRGGLLWFSVVVTADQPVVASMSHYDLFLGGGWATLGTPIWGLLPVSTV